MYWTTKVLHLQEHAEVVLEMDSSREWCATWKTEIAIKGVAETRSWPNGFGPTPAAAVDDLWASFVVGKVLTVNLDRRNQRRVWFNGKWKDYEDHPALRGETPIDKVDGAGGDRPLGPDSLRHGDPRAGRSFSHDLPQQAAEGPET